MSSEELVGLIFLPAWRYPHDLINNKSNNSYFGRPGWNWCAFIDIVARPSFLLEHYSISMKEVILVSILSSTEAEVFE